MSSIIRAHKFILAIYLVSAVLVLPCVASEANYEKLRAQGMDLAYNLRFEQATSLFDQLIQLDPQNPNGYLLQAVNSYYRYQLGENSAVHAKNFLNLAEEAIVAARRQLAKKEHALDAMFCLGTAHMYIAAYHTWESNWLRAYWYGKEGINYLKRVVDKDATYFDAYLGLGLYHYYADVLPRFAKAVTFVLGIDSDKRKGLAELELAAEQGTYSRAEALLFLGSIHLYIEKDYQKSLTYFKKLAELYPENGSYLMLLGESYQKIGENEKAIATLTQLVREEKTSRFPVLVVSSYFRLGNLYYNTRNLPKAVENYQRSLQFASGSTGNVGWVFALANLNIGRSYDLLGRRREALKYYRKVRKADHKHAYELAQERIKTPLSKGNGYARNRNYDEIIDIYQDALKENRGSNGSNTSARMAELRYHIGKSFYDKGAYQSAMAKFTRVLASQSVEQPWLKPWAHYYLGSCYQKTGAPEKARIHFKAAYRFDNSDLKLEVEKALQSLPSG
ncbi:MAG: tetratricopeptide repeat protein [Calditrichaeota bacterium]|nr:tetratricopeptide repeat protein [Calditrichota bacterium]